MKSTVIYSALMAIAMSCGYGCEQQPEIKTKIAEHPTTFCNPINLNYRFMKIDGGNGIREAADPVVTKFKDKYYLFASKSSGYWSSTDFIHWKHTFISDSVLPIENYAPGIFVHHDSIYYVGSGGHTLLYRSADPESGQWDEVKKIYADTDPAFFIEDNVLYLTYGCSPDNPIYLQPMDLNTLENKQARIVCFNSDTKNHGWERPGERNELTRRPYIEGSWITKHDGIYYLQYAIPGTEWKTYADGAYTSTSPCGPFTFAKNSPVSYKPTGFIGGAGHGCVFKVKDNYWKAVTNSISVRHMFERRLSFYPLGFDDTKGMYTNTYLGDYPMFLPSEEIREQSRPDWMLLSFKKRITASSTLEGDVSHLVDEDARTTWVAKSNSDQEWVTLDLGHESTIHSIQINYDEYGATQLGYQNDLYQSYVLSASHDGKHWSVIADKSDKRTDNPHDYIEFEIPFSARFIRWENKGYNISENVSLREIRVFGKTEGDLPESVKEFTCKRNEQDPCKMQIAWKPVKGAIGYIVREGVNKNNLFHNYQVTDSTHLELTGLNAESEYFITIDTYNESGITKGQKIENIR